VLMSSKFTIHLIHEKLSACTNCKHGVIEDAKVTCASSGKPIDFIGGSCPLNLWSGGANRKVAASRVAPDYAPLDPGPGKLLKKVIEKITGESLGCTECNEFARQMNEWGWIGCWKNRQTIAQRMCDEAKKRAENLAEQARQMGDEADALRQRADRARQAADAIDPANAMSLFVAAWKEMNNRSDDDGQTPAN